MKEIRLTQGLFAKVDDEDYENLSKHKWYAIRIAGTSHTGKVYLYGHKAAIRKYKYDENGKKIGEYPKILMHNLIMNPISGYEVDHIDKDPLNNQKNNLRVVTHAKNTRNRSMPLGQYGVYGVRRRTIKTGKERWRSYIRMGNKEVYLGVFDTKEEASIAYQKKHQELNA